MTLVNKYKKKAVKKSKKKVVKKSKKKSVRKSKKKVVKKSKKKSVRKSKKKEKEYYEEEIDGEIIYYKGTYEDMINAIKDMDNCYKDGKKYNEPSKRSKSKKTKARWSCASNLGKCSDEYINPNSEYALNYDIEYYTTKKECDKNCEFGKMPKRKN